MKTVILKTAYHWHCDNCSAVNFSLPQKAELTDEEAEEAFRGFWGLEEWAELPDDWRSFEMVEIPEIVTCSECGEEFATMHEESLE